MILKELEKITGDGRKAGRRTDCIRNMLKEYLQVYVLSFIYTSAEYNKSLIFTGGTCLRHFYDLQRLSEDIDFDYLDELDAGALADRLAAYFHKRYKYTDAKISLKHSGRQVLIKFPVLKSLALEYTGGSNMLYVKMDTSPIPSGNYTAILSSESKYGFNYVARHYDLPDLMAGKLHAVLTRRLFKGKDSREALKGRDYFDLLWFLKKGTAPNIARLSDMLGESVSGADIVDRLKEKVNKLGNRLSELRADILPLVENSDAVRLYVDNYQEEFFRNIKDVRWG